MNTLNEMQEGVLKEIGNVGAGHIVMSLTNMTSINTNLDVTRVYEFDGSLFEQIIGHLKNEVQAIDFKFTEHFSGGFVLILPKNASQKATILIRSASVNTLNSFLMAYSKSLEDYLGIKCRLAIRKRHECEESVALKEIFKKGQDNKFLLVDTRYSMEKTQMTGHMMLYFNSGDYGLLLERIDNKLKEMVS